MEFAEHEPGRGAVAVAAAAALAAGVVGGVVWALVVRWSDYEVGIVAWAIGWLAGTAAVLAARGSRGTPFQVAAVVAALVGILVGKYLAFAWLVQEDVRDAGGSVGLFGSEMRTFFRDELGTVFGWIDLLFVGFAVYTAWRIPGRAAQPAARVPDDVAG